MKRLAVVLSSLLLAMTASASPAHADATALRAAIVDAILALSKTLNLRSIAEGIEDAHQLAYLVEKGCDLLQGYYFARPIYPEEVPDMLRQNFSDQIAEAMAG